MDSSSVPLGAYRKKVVLAAAAGVQGIENQVAAAVESRARRPGGQTGSVGDRRYQRRLHLPVDRLADSWHSKRAARPADRFAPTR